MWRVKWGEGQMNPQLVGAQEYPMLEGLATQMESRKDLGEIDDSTRSASGPDEPKSDRSS